MASKGKGKNTKKDRSSKKVKSSDRHSSSNQVRINPKSVSWYTTEVQREWPTSDMTLSDIEEQQVAAGTNASNNDHYAAYSNNDEGLTPMERFERETQRQSAWNNVSGFGYK